VLGLLVTGAGVLAQDDGDATASAPRDPPNALDEFIDDVTSFSATFRQEVWDDGDELIETSTGRLSLLRPDRFRLTYETPYESLIVADGETLWMYDVDLEQVTRAPFDDGFSQTPAMLLSGDRSVSESFDVTQSYHLEGRDWVKLVPKEPGGDYASVLLAFAAGVPDRLEVVDGLNQTTLIEFSDIEVNPELERDFFEFEPPAGVDVIGGDR
jgi:outer membrane lipoprotein carrier protein